MRRFVSGFVRRHKYAVPAAVVVIVAASSTGAWAATRSGGGAGASTTYVAATTGTIKQTVSATGTVAYAQIEDLSFGASGAVTAVNVAAGDKVAAGQVLATVDSASLQSSVAAAMSTVATDNAKVSNDESAGVSSAQLAADQAALAAARAELNEAQKGLSGATLTSPIVGTVSGVTIGIGDQIGSSGAGGSVSSQSTGSSGSGAGSSAAGGGASASSSSTSYDIEVVSTDLYVVTASLDDTEVGDVTVGDQATLTPSGSATLAFGRVTSVSATASTDSTVSTYPVAIGVTGTGSGLNAGQSVTAAITYKQVANAVSVPILAVLRNADGTQYVLVRTGNRDVKTTVTTGTVSAGLTQILTGLTGGEKVVVTTVDRSGGAGAGTRSGFGREGFAGGGGAGFGTRGTGAAGGTGAGTGTFGSGNAP